MFDLDDLEFGDRGDGCLTDGSTLQYLKKVVVAVSAY